MVDVAGPFGDSTNEALRRLDPTDPAFVKDPYPVLAGLRESTRAAYDDGRRQWVISRFTDVSDALRNNRLGRTYRHHFSDREVATFVTTNGPRWPAFERHERWSLLELEPPDHTRIRRLVSRAFSPRAVECLAPHVGRLADRFLDACLERASFDVIAGYAQPFSVAVICALLGVPESDTPSLLEWSHAIVKMYEMAPDQQQQQAAERAAQEFMDYVRSVLVAKRAAPAHDLVSGLADVEDEEGRLSDDEIVSTVILLLNAGHEATVNTLGNGMRAFMLNPGQWRRLVDGEIAPRTALEEMVRWDAPLQLFDRWVLEDTDVAGRRMRRGERVVMLFGAANRDPRRFPEPDRFDPGRGDSGHLGFGAGIHFCLGAHLARCELEVSLQAFRDRAPGLHLAAEPVYQPTFVLRGLRSLHVSSAR